MGWRVANDLRTGCRQSRPDCCLASGVGWRWSGPNCCFARGCTACCFASWSLAPGHCGSTKRRTDQWSTDLGSQHARDTWVKQLLIYIFQYCAIKKAQMVQWASLLVLDIYNVESSILRNHYFIFSFLFLCSSLTRCDLPRVLFHNMCTTRHKVSHSYSIVNWLFHSF